MAALHRFGSPSSMATFGDAQHRSLPYIYIHFFDPGMMRDFNIPAYVHGTSIDSEFLECIYPERALRDTQNNPDFFVGRVILLTRNVDVDELNNVLLQKLNGTFQTFTSYDHIDLNDNALGRDEMTPNITLASLPLDTLHVRIGAPLMLMANLDPQRGLRNGARMILLKASHRCLEVRLSGGEFDGQCQLIYQYSLSTADDLPFRLTRKQFPVRLAFAMNIYKSQGLSFEHVGIVLPQQ
jgi:hypothetical protein